MPMAMGFNNYGNEVDEYGDEEEDVIILSNDPIP
jgi:hypothetical protein